MNRQIDLVWLGTQEQRPDWPLGEVWPTEPTPLAVHQRVLERLPGSKAEAWLFWDRQFGLPNPELVAKALTLPGDLWHAGLLLAMGGKPGLIDFIAPTWMLNCDPAVTVAATSWRLSLRACLVRTEALRQLGDVHPQFRTLEGASLEMGHRYVVRGGLTRHLPWLAPGVRVHVPPQLPFEDELRFVYHGFGRFWSQWAWLQAVLTCEASLRTAWRAQRAVYQNPAPAKPGPCAHAKADSDFDPQSARVSVLIPTLDRYAYLRKLLDQLRHQTVSPLDIVVIDQTAIERRDTAIADDFGDLPLRLIYRDQPGQCTARNAGLCVTAGDYVLFLDDDVEVGPDLIEAHLRNLHRFRAGASSGVARETGAGTLPEMFTYTRASDVFPTGNTLISKAVLQDSGLFDLAFDRGQRADGDLGMRVYLSGALMVLDPEISVLHHHAPVGGLRAHKARVITYASSRTRLKFRQLASATEIYLAKRYFTSRQLREMLWLNLFGTFSMRGNLFTKAIKLLISSLYLPMSLFEIGKNYKQALAMLKEYPQIPSLTDREAAGEESAPVKKQARAMVLTAQMKSQQYP